MSTRTRPRPAGKSYTARLRQRTATPRRPRLGWLRYLPPALALVAELGHLTAAFAEWPASTVRGVVHVLAAAALGLIAVSVYCGLGRPALVAGIVVTLAIPIGWLAGALAGAALYHDYPVPLAGVLTGVELTAATLLALRRHRVT